MNPEEIEKIKLLSIIELDEELGECVFKGDLKSLKYILTNTDIFSAALCINKEKLLQYACEAGEIEIVDFLLNAPNFKDKTDINIYSGIALKWACLNDHIEIVKLLYNHPSFNIEESFKLIFETTKDSDVSYNAPRLSKLHPAKIVAEYNYLSILKYFFEQSLLQENFHNEETMNAIFEEIFKNTKKHDYKEMLVFLIMEANIKETPIVMNIIENLPVAKEIWGKRKFNEKLTSELENNATSSKRVKI